MGSAFIKYANDEAAERVKISFDGRKFEGRTVEAMFSDDRVSETFQVTHKRF